LTYRHGPLISSVEVFTIFWGSAWQAAQSNLAAQINHFFDFVVTSQLVQQLGEYSVPAYKIGPGKHTGTATITQPAPTRTVHDSALQHFLQNEIAHNPAIPPVTPNSLYSSTPRRACGSCRAERVRAPLSVGIITTSPAPSITRQCRTRAAPAVSVA
jgi:hypothetical protein